MSLRALFSVMVTALFVLVLLSGVGLVIANARHAVQAELESTAQLTLRLLARFTQQEPNVESVSRTIADLNTLQEVRHLCVRVVDPAGRPQVSSGCVRAHDPAAPGWFSILLRGPEIRYTRPMSGGATLVVEADPADEIDEAWRDARLLIALIVLAAFVANAMVYLALGRAMRPLGVMQQALDHVAAGDYARRLPSFALREFGYLSQHFNSMTATLQQRSREVEQLSRKTLTIQEEERRALARELHDEFGQALTAIKADAASIERQNAGSNRAIAESTGAIIEVVNRLYQVMKSMMSRLRPGSLDELGLVSALEDMVSDWNARQQTRCRFLCEGEVVCDKEPVNIHLYRIVQEALTNIEKHAAASQVTVKLVASRDRLDLIVADDGRGFDVAAQEKGFGLLGMRERTEFLDGDLRVVSTPGGGTELRVTVPCA